MEIKMIDRDAFQLCGYAVETTLQQNDKDVAALYNDFFQSDKASILRRLSDSREGFYGLSWYTEGHKKYCYLLGVLVEEGKLIPDDAILKRIPQTTFAVASFTKGTDVIKAWTDFFYDEIPKAGCKVNEEVNLYFEYYPEKVDGDFELWVPALQEIS